MPTILSHGGKLIPDGCWSVIMTLKVLILAGTSDARELGLRLAADRRFAVRLSFAGRTLRVADPGVPYRVGGFGGVAGLVSHLGQEGYHVLVDATHPFAAQMSRHAAVAAELARVPLLRLERPAWPAAPGDRWTLVPSVAEAPAALGPAPRRVFLGIGRLEVGAFAAAPAHDYLIRAVDPFAPPLPRARVIAARAPFALADERALFERERIEVVVSKNAGTPSTYAKIEAARELGLPVIMVARPSLPPVTTLASIEAALAWLQRADRERHGASSMKRGV
jgi:precorrin-6A/cobalt-precorrin-6A reductase